MLAKPTILTVEAEVGTQIIFDILAGEGRTLVCRWYGMDKVEL